MADMNLLAVGCGTCGLVRECHHVPDFCRCRARFYRATTPLVLVWLESRAEITPEGEYALSYTPVLDWRGSWPTPQRVETQRRVRELVAGL